MAHTLNKAIRTADSYQLVAHDAQNVSFRMKSGDGEYRIETAAAPLPSGNGHFLGFHDVHLTLEAGEFLFVIGEGEFVATADTFDMVGD